MSSRIGKNLLENEILVNLIMEKSSTADRPRLSERRPHNRDWSVESFGKFFIFCSQWISPAIPGDLQRKLTDGFLAKPTKQVKYRHRRTLVFFFFWVGSKTLESKSGLGDITSALTSVLHEFNSLRSSASFADSVAARLVVSLGSRSRL